MTTGYEVRMYHDIHQIAQCLNSIAMSLEKLSGNSSGGAGGISWEIGEIGKSIADAIDRIPEHE